MYQPQQAASGKNHSYFTGSPWLAPCVLLLGLLGTSSGCNAFGIGNSKLVQELQVENDRLLAEFRAERDKREKTEKTLQLMESRLAESEKLLARQYSPGSNRLTQQASAPINTAGRPGYSGGSRPGFSSEMPGAGTGDSADSNLRWQRRVGN